MKLVFVLWRGALICGFGYGVVHAERKLTSVICCVAVVFYLFDTFATLVAARRRGS